MSRSAYYSRNNSYSRSFNAECAESEGRFPETRAAKYMGLSLAAFRAGCRACGYSATEWHHVGKYASRVSYFDTEHLTGEPEFWESAAAIYKTKAKRAELMELAGQAIARQQATRRNEFRLMLIHRRNCEVQKPPHKLHGMKWEQRCTREIRNTIKLLPKYAPITPKDPPRGDAAAFAAWRRELAWIRINARMTCAAAMRYDDGNSHANNPQRGALRLSNYLLSRQSRPEREAVNTTLLFATQVIKGKMTLADAIQQLNQTSTTA